ncbi:MAG: hypothetical protein K0Q69_1250 [Devosia sp.]|jgi:hypothetical protein|nr:hypothetical protein [Devosia sp.]
MADSSDYAARFEVDYPGQMDRLTTFFRLIWAIPILIVLSLLSDTGGYYYYDAAGNAMRSAGGGITAGLFFATVLMLVFRQFYPRWWFDFGVELARFSARVGAYLFLLTDKYPSTVDAQSVHLAGGARHRRGAGDDRRVVRHPHHRQLPPRHVRFRRRRRPVVRPGLGLCLPARHRCLPAVQPALARGLKA